MGHFSPVTETDLLGAIKNLPTEFRQDGSKRSFWLAISVIKYFFGQEWLDEHVSWESTSPGFLRVIPGYSAETQISTFRIVDFAELLWNLQTTTGFDICIDRLRQGVIESTYAELDLGRMLYCNDVMFRYVEPQQKKTLDYDLEITLPDGMIVCADAKCKLESTEFSADTVKHSLEKARKQFPKDCPSFIFMKVPSRWIRQYTGGLSLNEIAENWLCGTRRVVSVKFYFSEIIYVGKYLVHDHSFKEISNNNNRFDRFRDWNMFAEPKAPRGWNGMPPQWKRLLFFPDDGPA
jgi:hypothetical protein